jgi:flagellar protein FlgJ
MTQTQRTGQNNDGPGAARRAATTPAHRLPVIDKSKVDPQVRAAGEGMEAMFIDYMMKVMRETVPKSDMDLESPATEIYRGMLDAETSQRAAKSGGVGIADQIIAYLESQKYTLPRGEMGGEMGRPPSPQGIQRVAQQAVKTVSPESPRSNEASADATMSNPGAHAANGIGGTTHENY